MIQTLTPLVNIHSIIIHLHHPESIVIITIRLPTRLPVPKMLTWTTSQCSLCARTLTDRGRERKRFVVV
jgi:hypothetical protein